MASLSDIAIKRPVTSIVMSLIIVVFGAVGFSFLGVRLYPAIDPPTINVQTNYTGANADIIESQITEPLEKAINGIEGVKSISSSSSIGSSNITVEFNVGADLEKSANDVRDKTSQTARSLPQDIDVLIQRGAEIAGNVFTAHGAMGLPHFLREIFIVSQKTVHLAPVIAQGGAQDAAQAFLAAFAHQKIQRGR